ncbi:hypothetical protein ACHAXA_009463 [Cyclostephanos tholiformis]|uniref:Uncharacterized protein n=1 Tax=Cyclostephanos tholiformis TaxID=382380 RepID=A0ABD3RAM6_9STRA
MGFAEQIAARAAERKKSYEQNRPHNDRNVGPIMASPRLEKTYICGEVKDNTIERSSTSSFAEQSNERNVIVQRCEDHSDSHEDPKPSIVANLTSRKKTENFDRAKYVNGSIVVCDRLNYAKNYISESSPSMLHQSTRWPLLSKTNTNDNFTCISSQSTWKKAASEEAKEEDGMIQSVRYHEYPGNDCEASTSNNSANSVFGAWEQIEKLKRRLHDAEECALRERQRADNATFELRLVKQGKANDNWTVSSIGEDSTEVIAALKSVESDCFLDGSTKTTRERHELVSDSLSLAATGAMVTATSTNASPKSLLPNCCNPCTISSAGTTTTSSTTTAHLATSSHVEDTGTIIRLKNAEINILRSQVRRLEMRIQNRHDRNINDCLNMTESMYYGGPKQLHYEDALPLEVATECMVAHPAYFTRKRNQTPIEELRLLRNDFQTLQRQLRIKNGVLNDDGGIGKTAASNEGLTLSLREGHDDNLHAQDGIDEETEEEEGETPASWGLCCLRRRWRRGYGRIYVEKALRTSN